MIRPGAIDTGPELDKYFRDLAEDHEFRVSVTILDGNEDELTSLTTRSQLVVDGAVTVDATMGSQGVSRQLTLTIVDPKGRLQCDPASPAAGAIGPGQFVAVTRSDFAHSLGRWVEVPVFHGPLTAFGRQGAEVTLEGMGTELYLLPPFGIPKTLVFHKGHLVMDAIHDIAHACGVRKFDLPHLPHAHLHKNITIHKWEPVWPHIIGLAGQVNRHAFFNGTGHLVVRAHANNSHRYSFTGGPHGVVDADTLPSVRFDFLSAQFINTAVGVGKDPKGQAKAPHVIVTLPQADPLSPLSMAFNGEPLHAVEHVQNDHWSTKAEVREWGRGEVNRKGNADTTVDFECVPIPVFEERDPASLNVTVDHVLYRATFNMTKWTLPLGPGQAMAVGNQRPRWRKTRHKNHGKAHHGGK